ncbi:hydrolase [Aureococcus anophagefferens]|nr:hydrolase [Aureococcus anophagefferens]
MLRVSRDRASNLRRAAELIDAAAADGAQFVALPECFTGKYGVDLFHGHREALAANADAEAASGSAVLASARRHAAATGGAIEEHAGKLYNTMPVYGPDGALVAAYRRCT